MTEAEPRTDEEGLSQAEQEFPIEGKSYSFLTSSIQHEKVEVKGKATKFFVNGYISTSDIDAVNDMVTREALADMLKQIKGRVIPLKIDVEHEIIDRDTHEIRHIIPVGKVIDGRLDNIGLWVKVQLNDAIDRFDEVWGSIKNGNLDAFSIAFRVKDFTHRMINGVKTRILKELDLINITLTGMPINPAASITDVFAKAVRDLEGKGDDDMADIEEKKKHVHSAKWDRCVTKVRAAGGVSNPEALCTAVLGAEAFKSAHTLKEMHKVERIMKEEHMDDKPNKKAAEAEAKADAEAEAKVKADAEQKAAEVKEAAEKTAADAADQGKDNETKAVTELKARLDAAEEKNADLAAELKELKNLPILKAAAPAAAPAAGNDTEQKAKSPLDVI